MDLPAVHITHAHTLTCTPKPVFTTTHMYTHLHAYIGTHTHAHTQHTLCVSARAELSRPVQALGLSNLLGIEKTLLGRATKRELELRQAPEDEKPLSHV